MSSLESWRLGSRQKHSKCSKDSIVVDGDYKELDSLYEMQNGQRSGG
jgi:hypothetical protein